jgi:DNA-binding CsgD family transcriptional regulator
MPSVNDGREVPQADLLEERFGLTPAQARLVVQLVAGDSLRSAAKALGVKYETARSCLKPIFQKTRTHRQAELVLTVLSAMSDPKPLALPVSPPRMIRDDPHRLA